MAQNFWTAIFAFATSVILTVGLSFATKQQKSDEELKGLVYSLTPRVKVHVDEWYNRPVVLAVIVGVIMISLSIIFW
jgi:SSS family solute:Na+ symporter